VWQGKLSYKLPFIELQKQLSVMNQYFNSPMHFLQLLLLCPLCLSRFVSNVELFSFPVPFLLQASQLLRHLCMQNMVWTYCKRISPEWKQQVQDSSALFHKLCRCSQEQEGVLSALYCKQ